MKYRDLVKEIVGTYRKHGWQWRRALVRPENRQELNSAFDLQMMETIAIAEAELDALWFSRGSRADREAWELRLVAETPFALFETFEKDETEEQREEMRKEMEARMREKC